jgi:hypothetical protein
MTKTLGHWEYSGESFEVDDYFGFVYLITVTVPDGNPIRYIGKKQFHSYKKRKRDKESNWKKYTSSSKHINGLIKEGSKVSFEIIQLFETRGGLTAAECKVQWYLDVLTEKCSEGVPLYLNRQIGAVKFIPKEEVTDETKQRLDELYRTGRLLTGAEGEEGKQT